MRNVALLAMLLAAPASAPAAGRDPRDGRLAGPPVECIAIDRVRGPEIYRNGTIVYRQSGQRMWVTQPIDGCPGLRPPATLIVAVYGRRLCRHDRFRVQRSGSTVPGPICRFGPFVPYDRPTARTG